MEFRRETLLEVILSTFGVLTSDLSIEKNFYAYNLNQTREPLFIGEHIEIIPLVQTNYSAYVLQVAQQNYNEKNSTIGMDYQRFIPELFKVSKHGCLFQNAKKLAIPADYWFRKLNLQHWVSNYFWSCVRTTMLTVVHNYIQIGLQQIN